MVNNSNLIILTKLLRVSFINEVFLKLATNKNVENIAHVSNSSGFLSLSNESYFIAIAQDSSDLELINAKMEFIFNREKIIVFLEKQHLEYKTVSIEQIETECLKDKAISINNIYLCKLRETFGKKPVHNNG